MIRVPRVWVWVCVNIPFTKPVPAELYPQILTIMGIPEFKIHKATIITVQLISRHRSQLENLSATSDAAVTTVQLVGTIQSPQNSHKGQKLKSLSASYQTAAIHHATR